jgi:hypothetical protein
LGGRVVCALLFLGLVLANIFYILNFERELLRVYYILGLNTQNGFSEKSILKITNIVSNFCPQMRDFYLLMKKKIILTKGTL